jgi:hypothetical protein
MLPRMSRPWSLAFALCVISTHASAQLSGSTTAGGCISVLDAGATVSAKGRLALRHMPGPPNFKSIARGDEDRLTLILTLPVPVCIDDGGDFADPKVRFNTVHVWTLDPIVHRNLRRAVGRTVTISGEGYAWSNALHYAPLVNEAMAVTTR